MARLFLAAFAVFAVVDWLAVARGAKRLEYVAKPAALAALVGYAASGAASAWLMVALSLSLAGDVFLMLPADLFLAGLGAFFLAHLAYVASFQASVGARLACWIVLTAIASPIASQVLRAVAGSGLRVAVALYMLVLTLMVASAVASGSVVAAAGAVLFLGSDSLIAWNRFVRPVPAAEPLIMVTYHLGQLGLVSALRA